MKFISTLQAKILIALVFLGVLFVGVTYGLNKIYQSNLNLANHSNSTHNLSQAILNLDKNNQHYIANAPRDYESYNRDIQVFNQTLQQDINSIEQSIISISTAFNDNQLASDSYFLDLVKPDFSELNSSLLSLEKQWTSFKEGLAEKLGNKPDEPRLEWGAIYITENSPSLSIAVNSLISQLNQISTTYNSQSENLTLITLISFISIIGLYLLGFFLYVIRPLKQASLAFSKVSTGDYGFQIPNVRNDEIGELTSSFNSMSSRTELVLSIISRLQNSNHPLKSVEEFNTLSSGYLGADFVGLLQVNPEFSMARYSFMTPQQTYKKLKGESVNIHAGSNNDAFLQQLQKNEIILIDNLKSYIEQNADSDLVKPLAQNYSLNSAIVVPLQSDKWKGILLIASYKSKQFNQAQIELLESVSSLIAKGFHSSLIRAKAFQKARDKAA